MGKYLPATPVNQLIVGLLIPHRNSYIALKLPFSAAFKAKISLCQNFGSFLAFL